MSNKDSMNYCNLKFSCHRLAEQKETWFVARKPLQKFLFSKKEHAYFHCKHIFFELFTIFQSSPSNNMKKIWEAGATTLDKIYWNFWIFSTFSPFPQFQCCSRVKKCPIWNNFTFCNIEKWGEGPFAKKNWNIFQNHQNFQKSQILWPRL